MVMGWKDRHDYERTRTWLRREYDREAVIRGDVRVAKSKGKGTKLTAAKLKKQLQSLPYEELVALVVDCFKVNKDVERYLTIKLIGDEAVELIVEVGVLFVQDYGYFDAELYDDVISAFERMVHWLNQAETLDVFYEYEDRIEDAIDYAGDLAGWMSRD